VLRRRGKFAEAKSVNREELKLTKARWSSEHLSTITSQNNLALTLKYQGKLKEARVTMTDTLSAIHQRGAYA
jgi:hypothetical protein